MANQTHTTSQGETFDIIAYNELGNAKLASQIMELNPGYMDVVFFSSGVELVLPEVPATTTSLPQPPWKAPGGAA